VFFRNPNFAPTTFHIRDWVNPKEKGNKEDLFWVCKIIGINPSYLEAKNLQIRVGMRKGM
jgi:hypothetical protein